MRKMLRVTLVLMLVLLLLALAVPVLGADTVDGTAGGEGILDTPGTSSGTKALVKDLYPYEVQNFGGSRNIPD